MQGEKMNFYGFIKKVTLMQAILPAFAFSFFFTIALPLQTYLSNRQMFDYGGGALLVELAIVWGLIFFAAYFASIISEIFLGKLFHLCLLILAICGYLEVGILSIGLPSMNGEAWLFNRPTIRIYLDLWIFLTVGMSVLVFRRLFVKYLHWISLAFLVLCIAFIFDANNRNSREFPPTTFDDGFCTPYEMAKSIEFSTNRNVVVIIIDSTPADLAQEVILGDVKLRDHFKGFVSFPNNIGMHDCTTRAMPAFVTGKYLEKKTTIQENEISFWGKESAVKAYLDFGYNLYVRNYIGRTFTNKQTYFTPKVAVRASSILCLRYTICDPYLSLKDIVCFRLIPYRRKFGYLMKAMQQGRHCVLKDSKDLTREDELYPIVQRAPATSSKNCFCLIHTDGVHVPIYKDSIGRDLIEPTGTRSAIKEYLKYVLWRVADVMDSLVAKGVYEKTLLILATDHGELYDPKSALLWVKPIGATGDLQTSYAPTSHSRIATLLKESVTRNLDEQGVVQELTKDVRCLRIRQLSPEKWWQFGKKVDTYDILYDASGKEMSRKDLGEFIIN